MCACQTNGTRKKPFCESLLEMVHLANSILKNGRFISLNILLNKFIIIIKFKFSSATSEADRRSSGRFENDIVLFSFQAVYVREKFYAQTSCNLLLVFF